MRRFFYILYFIGLVYIVWLMPTENSPKIMLNIIPFQTIDLYITAWLHGFASFPIILSNLIGNIIITIPIGFLLFQFRRMFKFWEIIFFSFYIPSYIEFVQLLLHIIGYGTRTIDIDDVILNASGIWIGILIAYINYRRTNANG